MIELPPLPHQLTRDERHQAHEARERILQARIAELERQLSAALEAHDSVHDALSSVMKENAELEADAGRYRWLRDRPLHPEEEIFIGVDGPRFPKRWAISGEAADAAIDAARKA